MPSATYFTLKTVCRFGSSLRASIIAAPPAAGSGTAESAEIVSTARSLLTAAAFAPDSVPLADARAVVESTALALAEGKPTALTEPSRGLESAAACASENGGAVDAEASWASSGRGRETEAGAGTGSGRGREADGSAIVDWAGALRRRMPLNPKETGGAGALERPVFGLSTGPTVTMILFPSAFIV